MSDTLFSNEDFLFYADYFALAARSGVEAAQSIYKIRDLFSKVRIALVPNLQDSITARNNFEVRILSAYGDIYSGSISTTSMQDAFLQLKQHILDYSDLTQDEYLTLYNLKVKPTYASISRVLGEDISSENIEDSDY